tara:strand:- start:80 stop:388 length:309 start_codon:yes stop_codon:yes gene_type:complete
MNSTVKAEPVNTIKNKEAIFFFMILSFNMIFYYIVFSKLNEKEIDSFEDKNSLVIYETNSRIDKEMKLLKMNEQYLNEKLDILESFMIEISKKKITCVGICW